MYMSSCVIQNTEKRTMNLYSKFSEQEKCFLKLISTSVKWLFKALIIIINDNFIQNLNQLFVSKPSLWLYSILTRGELNKIDYYIVKFTKKRQRNEIYKTSQAFRSGICKPWHWNLDIGIEIGNVTGIGTDIINPLFPSLCEWLIDSKLSIHSVEDKTSNSLYEKQS